MSQRSDGMRSCRTKNESHARKRSAKSREVARAVRWEVHKSEPASVVIEGLSGEPAEKRESLFVAEWRIHNPQDDEQAVLVLEDDVGWDIVLLEEGRKE